MTGARRDCELSVASEDSVSVFCRGSWSEASDAVAGDGVGENRQLGVGQGDTLGSAALVIRKINFKLKKG